MTTTSRKKRQIQDYAYALTGRAINLSLRLMAHYNAKAKKMILGRRETLARLEEKLQSERPRLWIHASSLGEFEQGRPLIEAIRTHNPTYQIVLSFYSPSGYEVQQNYNAVDCVVYLPGDTPSEVESFLDALQPKLAIFIKYDFWAVMLRELERRHIPTYLVSAIFRKEQVFFKSWGGWYRQLLHCFTHIYVQDSKSTDLLLSIGIKDVTLAGDTRFDRVETIARSSRHIPEIEAMRQEGDALLVAGSTWQEDESLLAEYALSRPKLKIVFAPHEIDHIEHIEGLIPGAVRLSTLRAGGISSRDINYLIVDSFGLLSSIYRYADIAYVGGGFGKSIHNTIEAAVYGIPVIFGPEYHKFREAHLLIEYGAGLSVNSAQTLKKALDHYLDNQEERHRAGQAASNLVSSQLGASELIVSGLPI